MGGRDDLHRRHDAGLRLTRLAEHDELEWPFLGWMERNEAGRYVLPSGRERLPMMYTLEAVKPGADA